MVSGLVQGVCYRMDCRDAASEIGVAGWVRNLASGDVEVLAEGTDEQLAKLLAWCRRGPPHARVTSVREEYSAATGEFDSFEIGY